MVFLPPGGVILIKQRFLVTI